MRILNYFVLLSIGGLLCTACKGDTKKTADSKVETISAESLAEYQSQDVTGTYVSDGYQQRAEGYDWVGVVVTKQGENEIRVSVRSRADRKNPTCTFNGRAFKTDQDTYQAVLNGKTVLFDFKRDDLTIGTANEVDKDILYFYCSGGGSLAGSYYKIKGGLDAAQTDPTTFIKYLSLQDISFNVSAREEDGAQKVIIRSQGLDVSDEDPIIIKVPGEILDAEIEDLNSDGYPEVVVFSRDGKTKTGGVHGISVNAGKSMSLLYFPPTAENTLINKGYIGNDEFTLIETNLAQRFKLESGKTRQISYELVDGENGRIFRMIDISEY